MATRIGSLNGWSGGLRLSLSSVALVGMILLLLGACTTQVRYHGYAPDDAQLAQIQVGRDTRETVGQLLGSPGTTGVIEDRGWYYVSSRREQFAYRASQETDRQVVAISFDANGVVSNIERFGLQDGQIVALSRRITDTEIAGVTIIEQIFRNLGRFAAADFL